MHLTTCPVNYPRTRLLCYPATTQTLYQLLISSLSDISIYLQNTETKCYCAFKEALPLLLMPSLLPVSSWALRSPPSWLHAWNKSVWCFCKLSLAAALPDPHFYRKIIVILDFVWLLINSAYTAHNSFIEISVRLTLWTAKIIILSVPEESQITFLHLLWKFHQSLLSLLFPQTAHSLPSHWAFLMIYKKGRGPSLLHLCSLLW